MRREGVYTVVLRDGTRQTYTTATPSDATVLFESLRNQNRTNTDSSKRITGLLWARSARG